MLRLLADITFSLKSTATNVLSLGIPLEATINASEVASYEERQAAKKQKGETVR